MAKVERTTWTIFAKIVWFVLKGVFSCGDITGGLLQINKSTYEGAKAGLSAVNYIKNLN